MTSTTLHFPYGAARPNAVGTALRAVAGAARRTALAFLRSRHRRAAPAIDAVSAAEQANRVRTMAFAHMKNDPGFAADLFAAADHHELQHGA